MTVSYFSLLLQMYLSQYGYLNASLRKFNSDLINENDYTKAIVEFQAFAGLNITGKAICSIMPLRTLIG